MHNHMAEFVSKAEADSIRWNILIHEKDGRHSRNLSAYCINIIGTKVEHDDDTIGIFNEVCQVWDRAFPHEPLCS